MAMADEPELPAQGSNPPITQHQDTQNASEQRRTEPEVGRQNSGTVSQNAKQRGRGDRGGKKRDLGRSAWAKQKTDKRQRNNDQQDTKRRRIDRGDAELPIYATKFSDEVIAAEERRPKKKVAVLIGYSGTGYKGMQLAHDQKTIEGDLFKAFVEAGAISKANADDPKKSSFVRCARTDKGVHAAGNVISLKLIVEDEAIVQKINDSLSPQIRVWGFERTNNSFSAYQLCDSRIYEYLIPTHSFLPPHPSSFLGRRCRELAEQNGDLENFLARQAEVEGYWERVDKEQIHPILESYDGEARDILEKAVFLKPDADTPNPDGTAGKSNTQPGQGPVNSDELTGPAPSTDIEAQEDRVKRSALVSEGTKKLRTTYIKAKRAYRISESRLNRVRDALALYVGTRNYHNYTIQKQWKDPSAKRVIKSFVVNPTPILINGTEWLSLKVHGQSFMMHQIRKMVGMVALLVRCGCDPKRINESYGPENISIPKAPSLGLLLERPVFDSYNRKATKEFGKHGIDFDKFRAEMEEFKQRQIYERMYEDEERDNIFGNFFNHVDNFPSEAFLFVTSGGLAATRATDQAGENAGFGRHLMNVNDVDSDDEDGGVLLNDANGDEG